MAKSNKYDTLVIITNNHALLWKESRGIAPNSVAGKLDDAMLEWQSELTKTLKIWIDKGLEMTAGELILARANLGAVVESWLRFFYTVYYEDYCKAPITRTDKNGNIVQVEPEKASFENLKQFSNYILWKDSSSNEYKWVESVQQKRNAIHSFSYREIGTQQEFLNDIEHLYLFVVNVTSHFPPLEDYVKIYPAGYEMNVYFD